MAIVGPTGSGKARLAVAAARASGARVLSCDSMKVYRGMEIGTAKPGPDAREGVDWHGLDRVDPWERFDAARFLDLFEEVLQLVAREGRPLLLVGGTMLYLKAATEGMGAVPPRDTGVRARLEALAKAHGSALLHERLARVDPVTADRLHPNDLRRLVRALEVYELTSRPLSSFHGQFGRVRDDLERVVFVVERQRTDLDTRIDARIVRWMEQGWIEECRRLRDDPRGVSQEAAQALGYKQVFAWLADGGDEPLDALTARIQQATRRFARKQLTWIRKLTDARTLTVSPEAEPLEHMPTVVEALSR